MVVGLRVGVGCEVEYGGVVSGVKVALLVADEGGVVGAEAGLECAVGIDAGGLALLIEQQVLPAFDVEAASDWNYEYLCGVCEYILFRYGFLSSVTFIIKLLGNEQPPPTTPIFHHSYTFGNNKM